MAGAHWSALRDLLPAYQRITTVSIGDGRNTSFWDDTWLLDRPLAEKMPALHSHYAGRATSVRDVVTTGLRNLLQHRLTVQVATGLDHLEELLQEVSLDETPDQRSSFFEDEGHRLLSRAIYRTSTRGDHVCPSYKFAWANFAPPRVKFFGWLLTQNIIQCRSSLVRNHIVDDACCEMCGLEDETADHIVSGCNFVRTFWNRIGWAPCQDQ
ncbi:uncharacterized protein [Miscanthus floridulus]|uniref:uncharacterized protein n=1 Tax=Miscanthus floridulus TaxID=154761 RepID=UPI003457CF06